MYRLPPGLGGKGMAIAPQPAIKPVDQRPRVNRVAPRRPLKTPNRAPTLGCTVRKDQGLHGRTRPPRQRLAPAENRGAFELGAGKGKLDIWIDANNGLQLPFTGNDTCSDAILRRLKSPRSFYESHPSSRLITALRVRRMDVRRRIGRSATGLQDRRS